MELKILKSEKSQLDVELDSLTVAEVLRVYLNKQSGVRLVAWRREHPVKNPVLHLEADNPKVILKKAISAVGKDIDKAVGEFKELK